MSSELLEIIVNVYCKKNKNLDNCLEDHCDFRFFYSVITGLTLSQTSFKWLDDHYAIVFSTNRDSITSDNIEELVKSIMKDYRQRISRYINETSKIIYKYKYFNNGSVKTKTIETIINDNLERHNLIEATVPINTSYVRTDFTLPSKYTNIIFPTGFPIFIITDKKIWLTEILIQLNVRNNSIVMYYRKDTEHIEIIKNQLKKEIIEILDSYD